MAKKFEFKAKDVTNFVSWLKKFSSINDNLLLEIDNESNEFLAKTYNEERSVVKFSRVNFLDAGLEVSKSKKDNNRIKVGIHSINKLMKTLKHFSDSEFELIFNYDKLIEDNDKESLSGQSILMKNSDLKAQIKCTPLNIFKYIPDDLFKNNIAKISENFSADITQEIIETLNSLNKLDPDYKYIKFFNKENKVYTRSKSFEKLLGDSKVGTDTEKNIEILKEQFEKVDIENYSFLVGDDRLVFESKDSDTITVLSEVERNDNYEESEEESFE